MSDEITEVEKINTPENIPSDLAILHRNAAPVGYQQSPASRYSYGYGPEEDKTHVRELWRTIRKRKWLIASIVFIITSLVTVEMFRTKPTYQASTIIEIGKENSAIARSNDLVINDDSDSLYQVSIKTKMLLLNSRELHEDVVTDLKLDQNSKFVQGDSSSILQKLKSLLKKNDKSEEIDDTDVAMEVTAEDVPDGEPARSAEESARLAPFVEALDENLTIEPMRETRAIKVSFTHTDPKLAAAVANEVARAFKQRSFQAKTDRFTATASWLDSATRELKAKVQQSEEGLANYMSQHNIFSITSDDSRQQTTLTTDKLARLHDQAIRAETDRMLRQTLYEEVKAGRVSQLPEAFSDAKLIELQKQRNELQTQAAQLAVKFGPKSSRTVEVQQQLATVEVQIKATLSSLEQKLQLDYERALHDEEALKGALEHSKGEAAQENQAAIQYNILKQDLDTSRALYTDFLQKTNQIKAQAAEQHNNIRIIERAAVPKKPVGPKRLLMITLALLVSLGGSVGLVFFLEYLDNTIKNVEDVSRYIQLPALGVIPAISINRQRKLSAKNEGKNKVLQMGAFASSNLGGGQVTMLDTRSAAAEAYRALRTSVLLSAAGNPPKTILVTSSQPGEGKTTTCINTALSLAQLGSSVLIIDCDLRRPSTHKVFGVDQTRGLSTFLSRNISIDGLIQRLPLKNVSLLPCGPVPPNPAELISSEKMQGLIAALSERYDHILIDSPPLMNVTDSVILSRMVDGVILVVHGGKSSRYIVCRARQELVSVGAKIFGVVLNNVDIRSQGYEGYYMPYYRYEQKPEEAAV